MNRTECRSAGVKDKGGAWILVVISHAVNIISITGVTHWVHPRKLDYEILKIRLLGRFGLVAISHKFARRLLAQPAVGPFVVILAPAQLSSALEMNSLP